MGTNVDRLVTWKNAHGSDMFGSDSMLPKCWVNGFHHSTYWGKAGSLASYEGDTASITYITGSGQGTSYMKVTSHNHDGLQISSVTVIQVMLNALVERGYLGGSTISADGAFGGITASKVGDFQSRRGIEVDGVVGGQTVDALRSQLAL